MPKTHHIESMIQWYHREKRGKRQNDSDRHWGFLKRQGPKLTSPSNKNRASEHIIKTRHFVGKEYDVGSHWYQYYQPSRDTDPLDNDNNHNASRRYHLPFCRRNVSRGNTHRRAVITSFFGELTPNSANIFTFTRTKGKQVESRWRHPTL